jgi:flagellar biosynthesis protein FlhG
MGKKVVVVDLDLGGANLHTRIGVKHPPHSLSDFILGKVRKLEDLVIDTTVSNLHLISGAEDTLWIPNLKHAQKIKLLHKLRSLDADYIILDLGAGTAFNTLDFFLVSDMGIMVLVPEPTSIENTYRFIRAAFFRHLKSVEGALNVKELLESAMDEKNQRGIETPADLIHEVKLIDQELGENFLQEMRKFRPKIILNQIRTPSDIDIGFSIKSVCNKYFGLEIDYAGYLEYDASVWQAVRRGRPLLTEFPNSRLVSNFHRILKRLLFPNVKLEIR